MKRVVLVILDGLRRDFVDPERTPHLARFAARAESFPAYRTAFPSATRVVTATLATGCHPARHTLQGNAMVLMEDGRLVPHDAGRPDFLQHKRAVTGHSLAVPTLAERLAPYGGAIVYNNVSPGAAYAHDPDGFGHVYHRAGSFAPGRVPLGALEVELDAAGDHAITERFIADALGERRPALAVLWLGEPDHIQHNTALGSPEHVAVLLAADRNAGMAIAAVDACRDAGDDVLLVVGSDHGHETVSGVVDGRGGTCRGRPEVW
ncbi:MAG: alkaline phosphatase family protein [Acetobacteraceae bacterium]